MRNSRLTALLLIFTILNILFLPLLHDHEPQCCSNKCNIESEDKTASQDDNDSQQDCTVCKFVNKHTIVSLDSSIKIIFFPPENNIYCDVHGNDLLFFTVNHINKDPPIC